MPIANGQYLRWTVKQRQYGKPIFNSIDYKLVLGDGIPIDEINSDLRSHWGTWIRQQQVDDLGAEEYTLREYHRVTNEPPESEGGLETIKHHFAEEHTIIGAPDLGFLNDNPLPTFVAVSAAKIGSGLTTALTEAAGQTPNLPKDSKMTGGIRIAGISEDHTKNGQGNELATVLGGNWLGSWQAALTELIAPSFRWGATVNYTLQMQIRSDYGPGGVARVAGGAASIRFRPVSAISVNRRVGSQITRKQSRTEN